MAVYQYFFLPQNLKKITAEKCLAIAEKKTKELTLLREKINEQWVKYEELVQRYTKDALISPADLKLLERSKKNHLGAYNLILQLQDKILSHYILSAPWFANTSKTKTTQFLSQTEINNFLDVITVLSLSIELSEILHDALDEENFSHSQDKLSEKIEGFAIKVYSLPNNGNDFLNKISMELMHLAIACVSLCACFFMFVTISHFALIAAAVFVCTGLSFFGISGFIQFMNQKTEIVSSLIDIINYFKYQDLKLNFGSIFIEILNKSSSSNHKNITESEDSISPDTEEFESQDDVITFESIYDNPTENFFGWRVESIEPNTGDREKQKNGSSIPSHVGSLKSVEISSNDSSEDEEYEEISCGSKNEQSSCDDCLMSDTSSIQSTRSNGRTPNNDAKMKNSDDEWQWVERPEEEEKKLSDTRSTTFYTPHSKNFGEGKNTDIGHSKRI